MQVDEEGQWSVDKHAMHLKQSEVYSVREGKGKGRSEEGGSEEGRWE